ncbi:MAG: DcaP family trimeric outer membrane transporter [Rikenellaceae bacterium]
MKKFFLSLLAMAAISSSLYAQSSSLNWNVSDKTTITLGGFVRANTTYDFDGSLSGLDFISTNIASSPSYSDEGCLGFDASASRIWLMINQGTDNLGNVKVYFEGDFRGTNSAFRFRQAFVEFKGFVAGQTWSFFTDLPAQAPTMDIIGVGSRSFFRTALFGYRYSINDQLSAGISLESPALTTDYISGYEPVSQRMPNIPIYIQAKGGMGHIKAAAVFRSLQYGDISSQERVNVAGLGGQLSGSLKACSAVTIYGQAIYGKGINTFLSDLSTVGVGLSDVMTLNGSDMEATPMGGASLGLSAKLAPKWSAALSGSLTRNYGDQAYFAGDYKSTSFVTTTLMYNPISNITVGLEYLNGSRTDFGSDTAAAQRLSFTVMYTL